MNDATRREIDKTCWETLREAGIVRPPVRIEKVLGFLQLHREFYDLEDPSFLDRAKHKIKVHGQRLVNVLANAQTSGGLLIAVSADRVDALVDALRLRGTRAAMVVGSLTRGDIRTTVVRWCGACCSRRARYNRWRPAEESLNSSFVRRS